MSQDSSLLILLLVVVTVSMAAGTYMGLRERQATLTPVLDIRTMRALYWAFGVVQAIAFVLIIASWLKAIPAVWGQVAPIMMLLPQILLSLVEGRRGMAIVNAVICATFAMQFI